MQRDFFSSYMDFVGLQTSESPAVYHRWVCASIIGALLGRQVYLPFGSDTIYPNQYIMLMGAPGIRKGAALGIGKALIKAAGYKRFAADRTSKERFLMDFKHYDTDPDSPLAELEELSMETPAETYIYSGEFTDFVGPNNMEFITMLTNLWDNLASYTQPKITGKSTSVDRPTVNIIGANTPTGFAMAFPPEAMGNGFMSRVILIHGESNGVKIAWPKTPDVMAGQQLAIRLKEIRDAVKGEVQIHPDAREAGEVIYNLDMRIDDERFIPYSNRRYTHMLKLAIILAACDLTTEVDAIHMVRANTMLASAERKMPAALGQYGKGRYSEVSGKVLQAIAASRLPMNANELWKVVHKDLSKPDELAIILNSLKLAEKIQVIQHKGKTGYVPLAKPPKEWPEHLLDLDWLTTYEIA